jgi:DNA-binding SARP family transcriptional activator
VSDSLDLRVGFLGGFRLLMAGRSAARMPSVRQQQLIAFLVLHARSAPIARQRIAGSLWPESNDPQALTNLRRELCHLRDEWPSLEALVEAGTRTVMWRGEHAIVDVVAFEAASDRGLAGDRAALEEAARLYRGDVLPDATGEWIDADRERLRRRAQEVLVRLVTLSERDRACADGITYAQQLVRLDALDERAWCALMRSHAGLGERGAALHAYQQCAAILKRELGVQPSAATRATYRGILDLDSTAAAIPMPPGTAVFPLVGRDAEWRVLRNAWNVAAAGRPGLVLIRGESGIGKTRLADEQVHSCSLNNINAATTRCFPGEGRLAYAPLAAWLRSDALRPTLARLDGAAFGEVARLCPELAAARSDPPVLNHQEESWQRLRFFEALAQAFRMTAPIVLVVDDLQWADADTIEWLHYFLRSAGESRCLIVGAVRAEEQQDNPGLVRFLGDLEHHGLLTVLPLGPLDHAATGQLASAVAGHALDETTLARTFHETEGHPLFIIERGRMVLTTQPDTDADRPSRQVQAVVAARLALLSDEARAVAEVAAAVGRDFRFDILASASDLEEKALVRALDELWQRHIVREQADERWDFSHDRIREVAYSGIAPARRRLLHRRIAHGLEMLYADCVDDASASIAMHLERGGQAHQAIPYLERAAAVAMRLSANEEAIRCVTHALTLLESRAVGKDRDERELHLRSALSVALNAGRGYAAPEVEENLTRVLTLSRCGGRDQVPVQWLWAAFTLHFVRGDLNATRETAEATLARSRSDPSCRCEAHHAMGATLSSVGELDASRDHFEQALAAYDERTPRRSALGSDLGVFAHAWYAHTLWLLGDDAAALSHAEQGIALAERLDHLYSRTLALAYAALLHQMRRDTEQLLASANKVRTLCERHEIGYYGDWATILIGWARGQIEAAEGIEMIEYALESLDRQRAHARRPYYLSLLAETYSRAGKEGRASSILDAAIAMAIARSDVWWLPALYLQKSVLEPASTREATLRRGLDVARAQNSRCLERRILTALSRH